MLPGRVPVARLSSTTTCSWQRTCVSSFKPQPGPFMIQPRPTMRREAEKHQQASRCGARRTHGSDATL
jgi:hypothetical protein